MVRWKEDPARAELMKLYEEVDALLGGTSCDDSTDCCHFGRTGREPYPTTIEVAEIEHGVAAAGGVSAFVPPAARAAGKSGAPAKTKLPMIADDERPCPFLSAEGRCRIYASRPFGCRTFFCDRAVGPRGSRNELQGLGRRVADLSARAFPRADGPRTLESAFAGIKRGDTVRALRDYVPPRGRAR